ncbi:MAG: flippase-like domain-containing protein [Actinomycetota bacterium]|nr:flippase-like domain-containing protein [Actinomycetota bacterium]
MSGGACETAETTGQRRSPRPGRRLLFTLLIGGVCAGLLWLVAPPGAVLDQVGEMRLTWVVAAVGLELASCLGYVFVFRRLFPEPAGSRARQLAWIGMGAGAVLPGGNFCSAAATGWLLRRSGLTRHQLLTRCATLVSLFIAVNLAAAVTFGLLLLGRLAPGPHDLEHTALPTAVCAGLLLLMWACGALIRRRGDRAPRALRAVGEGIDGAWTAIGGAHWRLLGAAAYVCFDMAALWAACSATGHPVGFPAVVLAYEIGYLATLIPMPAGVGVLDAGLASSLALYGARPAAAVGAVLVYHAVAIWVPGLGGLAAWLPGRRERRGPAEAVGIGILVGASEPSRVV